jgi:hypothetical protein
MSAEEKHDKSVMTASLWIEIWTLHFQNNKRVLNACDISLTVYVNLIYIILIFGAVSMSKT